MVSVCLPSDALLQHLPSYLGFSYLGRGVSLHGCSSKVQPLLLTLDEGYLLTAALPDLQHGIAPLGPPAPTQPPLLGLTILGSGNLHSCLRNDSKTCVLSCIQLFVIPWTVAHQFPFSMAFSRQEYWNGFPFPTAGDLPNSRDQSCVSCIGKWILYHWATWEMLLTLLSHVQLFVTLWTLACQVPLSVGFSRQVYWSGLPFPSPGNIPDGGIKLVSLVSPAL